MIGIKLTRSRLGAETFIGRPRYTGLRAGAQIDWLHLAGTALGILLRSRRIKAVTPLLETHVPARFVATTRSERWRCEIGMAGQLS